MRWPTCFLILFLVCLGSGECLSLLACAQDPSPESSKRRRVVQTPLQLAIAAGLDQGAGPDQGLADRLNELEPIELVLRSDALAICDALSAIPVDSIDVTDYSSPAAALVQLFGQLEDAEAPAYEVLSTDGLRILTQLFDAKSGEVSREKNPYLLMEILEVLARYGTLEGTDKVLEAARMHFAPESYQWHSLFAIYSHDHAHRDRLFRALSRNLPSGTIGLALLDAANQASLQNEELFHPFDSSEGKRQLKEWLLERDPENYGHAHSSAFALAFLSDPDRDPLLALAMEHPNKDVQMEGAWSAAKIGRDSGLKFLASVCLDVNQSSRAQQYLREIGREDVIPEDANEPGFKARAEFAQWLAHPNELGVAPDEVEIIDNRELRWPLAKESSNFSVVRFLLRDRTGLGVDDENVGVVGSMTWCFFDKQMNQRPPEDVYAIHAYWEMENEELIKETRKEDPAEFAKLLAEWQGQPLESPSFLKSVKISRRLKIPSRQVTLVSANQDGQPGWVVLDGPTSAWYPASEQPEQGGDQAILQIHVGRQLLGFTDNPERTRSRKPTPEVDRDRWISVFEKYLEEADSAAPKRQVELVDGLLATHFETYLKYCESQRGLTKNQVVCEVFPRFLQIAKNAREEERKELVDSFSAIGRNLPLYVDALVESDRSGEVQELLGFVGPYLQHNLGYAMLGEAAYKAKLIPLAESNFDRLQESPEVAYRFENAMGLLARIWFDRGEHDRASELLLGCMKQTAEEIEDSEYPSDRQRFREELDTYRKNYLEMFPDGAAQMAELGFAELGFDPPDDPAGP
jgi:hypothetical protein